MMGFSTLVELVLHLTRLLLLSGITYQMGMVAIQLALYIKTRTVSDRYQRKKLIECSVKVCIVFVEEQC